MLFEQISADIMSAMKARETVRLQALRNIKKYFIEAKTAPGSNGELSDDAAMKNLQNKDVTPHSSIVNKDVLTLQKTKWQR